MEKDFGRITFTFVIGESPSAIIIVRTTELVIEDADDENTPHK
jgi:hypothetical protein